jgi:hypothetical protein
MKDNIKIYVCTHKETGLSSKSKISPEQARMNLIKKVAKHKEQNAFRDVEEFITKKSHLLRRPKTKEEDER